MNMITYTLSDQESLILKKQPEGIEFFNKHESIADTVKLGSYRNGRWLFDDYNQQVLFFKLFALYRKQFYKAIKLYNYSLKTQDYFYTFTCTRRKINIKIIKLKRGVEDVLYRYILLPLSD